MNLPENLSSMATKLYELLSDSPTPKSLAALTTEVLPQPVGEEQYKAIATADSLVVKGVLKLEKATEHSQPDFYTLLKSLGEVGPAEEADANEEYGKKTDTNEEEKMDDEYSGKKKQPALCYGAVQFVPERTVAG